MKIVCWNCSGSLNRKSRMEQLHLLSADIAVVPECAERDAKVLNGDWHSALWVRSGQSRKGLGVFARKGWTLTPLFEKAFEFRGLLPIKISGESEFILLAVWAPKASTGYVENLFKEMEGNAAWFDLGPTVVAGDFNSTPLVDKGAGTRKHSDLVQLLKKRGLVSVYHSLSGEDHGKETRPTYHHQWKVDRPFHIDYIFVPEAWIQNVFEFSVGPHAFWSSYSDHRPISLALRNVPDGQIRGRSGKTGLFA